MDMAFLNASNRADTFPPQDPWLAGVDLNYYYLGHLAMAIARQAGGARAGRGLQRRGRGAVRAHRVRRLHGRRARSGPPRAARAERSAPGSRAVALVVVGGNLEGARLLIADGGPLREYDWFAASRVVDDTINEFPWFSFLLGDLHAHVLALPFTLLALAFALQVVLAGPRLAPRGRALLEGGAAALALGFLYAVNSWSYPVLAGVLALAVVAVAARRGAPARWLLLVLAASALLVLPFHLVVRPGRARDRRGRGGAGLRGVAARPAAAVRNARRAARARLRRPADGDRAARPQRGLDRGRGVFARLAARGARLRARRAAGRRAARRAARVRPRRAAGAARLAAGRRAASRACSARSCCTCATSSTTARCTA